MCWVREGSAAVENSSDVYGRDLCSVTDSCFLHEQALRSWVLFSESLGNEIFKRWCVHGLISEMPSVRRVK